MLNSRERHVLTKHESNRRILSSYPREAHSRASGWIRRTETSDEIGETILV